MSIIKFKIDGGEGEVEGMKIKFGFSCVFSPQSKMGVMVTSNASAPAGCDSFLANLGKHRWGPLRVIYMNHMR